MFLFAVFVGSLLLPSSGGRLLRHQRHRRLVATNGTIEAMRNRSPSGDDAATPGTEHGKTLQKGGKEPIPPTSPSKDDRPTVKAVAGVFTVRSPAACLQFHAFAVCGCIAGTV